MTWTLACSLDFTSWLSLIRDEIHHQEGNAKLAEMACAQR